METKVAIIPLDEETRARLAKELGFAAGIDAIPTQIEIHGLPPDAPENDDAEVVGFDFGTRQSLFVSPSLPPTVRNNLATELQPKMTDGNTWVMATRV